MSPTTAEKPFTLAGLELSSRIVGVPHGTGMVDFGVPRAADAAYWRRRAQGGAAMLTVGGTLTGALSTSRNGISTEAWRPEVQPALAARAEAIRSQGVVACHQIVHLGRETLLAETFFHPVGPSAIRSPREPTRPRPLTDAEFDQVLEDFVTCGVNVHEAGFQAVELHAAHGYLLAQILSPHANVRPGAETVEGRVAPLARIVAELRSAIPEAVLGVRLSTEGEGEAGFSVDGICELLPRLGPLVDYVSVTVGVRTTYVRDMGTAEPPLLADIGRLRAATGTPLLVAQQFRFSRQIAAALEAGADLVGVARPLIADPDMPAKILGGRERSVRPCVSCNEDCRAFDPVALCSVNPELGRDGDDARPALPFLAAGSPGGDGPVAVIGAGPAGLECALRLAGSTEVVVLDPAEALGGALRVATAAPNRPGWGWLIDFYAHELSSADGVELRLGTRVDASTLAGFSDVVIAIGSEEAPPPPGAVSASAAIAGGPSQLRGERLLVVDDGFGWWPFASSVELGVAAGFSSIVAATPAGAFGGSLPPEGRVQLIDRLRGAPLEVRTFTVLQQVVDGRATLRNVLSGVADELVADAVIVVGERRARDWRELVGRDASVQVVGDALVPRRVAHAVAEGRAAAEAIRVGRSRQPATIQYRSRFSSR